MARHRLYRATAIPAAGTSVTDWITGLADVAYLLMQAKFDYGSGSATAKVYIQTSLDEGATAIDIACFAFATSDVTGKLMKVNAVDDLADNTTPTDAGLADNTTLSGVIGDMVRAKLVVSGAYADSTIDLVVEAK